MSTVNQERWLPVVGHEGAYEVSDLGRVRSLDRAIPYKKIDQYSGRLIDVVKHVKGKVLRPGRKPSGHLSVAIGKHNSRQVHQLVLEAFVGPCPPGLESLHKNDISHDNRLANLSWGSRSQNILDAIRNGGRVVGSGAFNAKLTEADIPTIQSQFGRRSFQSIADDYGVTESTIRQIRDGYSWKHVGNPE
ncbi:MAG: NUMOD4 motif-containing HNH endonuclease [Devosia sp.]|nr:NUMOD4 motif-containing HNH endonuclease [Devosia sp.]